ncbi:uncharacterized protein LOC122092169 [Macadamia integrifolia]|uniref:uncharacterized protein LOC122092169 n=1 Tax=Macadamia integrifolia TaxID=60698 RepID=UPI001C4E6F83|nr:uncharacterized protein LOC122092169 [Macadamia integrifolia]
MASNDSNRMHGKIPFFDGSNYNFWKIRMEAYLKSQGYEVWLAVKNGYNPPTTDITDKIEMKCEDNAKAMNALLGSLVSNESAKVIGCTTSKDIWDKLKSVHEGDDKIKEAKLQHHRNLFESLKMSEGETIDQFMSKVSAIEESKDLNTMKLDELHGTLIAYEMRMVKSKPIEKEVAFKALKKLKINEDSEQKDSDDELIAYLARKLKKDRGKYKGKLPLKCFNCDGIGHFSSKCPKNDKLSDSEDEDAQESKFKKGKKKFIPKRRNFKKKSLISKKCKSSLEESSKDYNELDDELSETLFMEERKKMKVLEIQLVEKENQISQLNITVEDMTKINDELSVNLSSKAEECTTLEEKLEILKIELEEIQKMNLQEETTPSPSITILKSKGKEIMIQSVEANTPSSSKENENVLDKILSFQRALHMKTGFGYVAQGSSEVVETKGKGTAEISMRFIKEKQRSSQIFYNDGFASVDYQRHRGSWQRQSFKGYYYGCNYYGHRVADCKRQTKPIVLTSKNMFALLSEKSRQRELITVANKAVWVEKKKKAGSKSLIVQTTFKAHSKPSPWVLDSGCSTHMTGDKGKFLSLDSTESGSVKFGNNDGAKIESRGIVKLDRGKIKSNNVLYVSGLMHNLLSVSQIYDNGNEVLFTKEGYVIKKIKNGKIVAQRTRTTGNLYTLLEANEDRCMMGQEDECWLWHRRIGHISFKNLAKLSKKKAVRDLPKIKSPTNHICAPCQKGKQTRATYKSKKHYSSKLLDLIHTDLCGPMRTEAIGGERYFILFIDEYSRMTCVMFLEDKTEALDCFKIFKKKIEPAEQTPEDFYDDATVDDEVQNHIDDEDIDAHEADIVTEKDVGPSFEK